MSARTHQVSRRRRRRSAFTLIDLLVAIATTALLVLLVVPTSSHVQPNMYAVQCRNNLRQLSVACKMYADDNNSSIVSAYPRYGGFMATWCAGSAETGGASGNYTYGGADPAGIQAGLLWPYTRTLSLYHCPTDHRVADPATTPSSQRGKPILRSISMNSYMAGMSYGASTSWTALNPATPRDPNRPVYLRDTEMKLPAQTFLLADEDFESINDGMLIVDVGGSRRFIDLPSRAHRFGYGTSFADGHAETIQFKDDASKEWSVVVTGGLADWMRLTNITTHPL